jgi:2-polyprenyl-3-methyl-5-hydroxy-6-metoxy-1,4-benzoquinol methylase
MTEQTANCLLCGKTADLKHAGYPGYMEPDRFSIYHCKNCNTAFSLPRTDTSAIYETIYKNAEKVPGYSRYMSYAGIVKEMHDPLRFLADSSEAYWGVRETLSGNRGDIRILEIGSGLGYLTYSLIRAGYDAKGIDISENAVRQATERFGNYYSSGDVYEYSVKHSASYDYVISTEVIEHIDRPVDFLSALLSLVKPGGKVIITTPNKSPYPDDIIWASDLPPVHLWWFSEDSVRYMAAKLGATAEFVDFTRFYRNNSKVTGIKSQRSGRLPSPFFNSKGELIVKSASGKSSLKAVFLKHFTSSPALYSIYRYSKSSVKRLTAGLKKLSKKDQVVYSDHGALLCAVITNP